MGYFSELDLEQKEQGIEREEPRLTKEELKELRRKLRIFSQEYDKIYGKKKRRPITPEYDKDDSEEDTMRLTKSK